MVPHILKSKTSDVIDMVGVSLWGHILVVGLGHNIIHEQNQLQDKK